MSFIPLEPDLLQGSCQSHFLAQILPIFHFPANCFSEVSKSQSQFLCFFGCYSQTQWPKFHFLSGNLPNLSSHLTLFCSNGIRPNRRLERNVVTYNYNSKIGFRSHKESIDGRYVIKAVALIRRNWLLGDQFKNLTHVTCSRTFSRASAASCLRHVCTCFDWILIGLSGLSVYSVISQSNYFAIGFKTRSEGATASAVYLT